MSRALPSALLGAASGLRSLAAPSQLSLHLSRDSARRPPGVLAALLSRDEVRYGLLLAAAGEMIADKLPVVPDRIEPGPLLGRAVFGGVSGGVLARLNGEPAALGVLLGGAGALVAAYAGFHVRRSLVHGAGALDLPVALAEDFVAIALARAAVRA